MPSPLAGKGDRRRQAVVEEVERNHLPLNKSLS